MVLHPPVELARIFSNFPGRGDQPGKLPIIPFHGIPGLTYCCKVLNMKRGKQTIPENNKGHEAWISEIEAKQRNLVWPDTVRNSPRSRCPLLQG
jgi:hypothetical protein